MHTFRGISRVKVSKDDYSLLCFSKTRTGLSELKIRNVHEQVWREITKGTFVESTWIWYEKGNLLVCSLGVPLFYANDGDFDRISRKSMHHLRGNLSICRVLEVGRLKVVKHLRNL